MGGRVARFPIALPTTRSGTVQAEMSRMGFRLFRLLDRLKEQAKPMSPPVV